MNYIKQINAFHKKKQNENFNLLATDVCLYFELLNKANSFCWQKDFFFLVEDFIKEESVLAKNTVYKSLNKLTSLGLIIYKKGQRNKTKPTVEVVQLYEAQAAENQEVKSCSQNEEQPKLDNDLLEVINHFEAVTGKTIRDGINNSNIKFPRARLKTGEPLELLKRVIDLKAAQWQDNNKMKKYLRLQTLFNATKFESYVSELATPAVEEEVNERFNDLWQDFLKYRGEIVAQLKNNNEVYTTLKRGSFDKLMIEGKNAVGLADKNLDFLRLGNVKKAWKYSVTQRNDGTRQNCAYYATVHLNQ